MSVVEIDLISVQRIELDLTSVPGSELTWFCVGVEKYLALASESKFTWFVSGHRN